MKGRSRLFAALVLLMVPLMTLWAQEMNEKYSLTTQMLLNEMKEKTEAPTVGPRRTSRLKQFDKVMKQKNRRLIASPDTVGGVAYISCFIHLKNEQDLSEVRSLGIVIEETFEGLGFITARVPLNQLESLAAIDNVKRIKVAQIMRPMTDVARQKTNVEDLLTLSSNATMQGVYNKYDGTGVVLGIIDGGIDFQHIAFKDKNGNSRIKRAYVYDGSSVKDYTESNISSATTDDNGDDHGTHTASTAGGSSVIVSGSAVTVTDNHANATYGGMAPGADLFLAGVKLTDTYITNALQKMVQYADAQGKPLVVSNSWGSSFGPHDGTGEMADLVSQYFGDSHPNRVILFSAGNEGDNRSRDNEGGGFFVKKSSASSGSPLGTIMRSATYSNTDAGNFYIGLMSTAWSSNSLNCKIHVLDSSTGAVKNSWTVTSSTNSFDGLNNYYSGTLYVEKGSENGKYYLAVYTDNNGLETQSETTITSNGTPFYKSNYSLAIEVYPASGSAYVNMWAGDYSYFSNHLSTSGHTWTTGTNDMCVSDQATIPNAISVGAYVSKNSVKNYEGTYYSYSGSLGDIAGFSSYATAAQSPTGQIYPWITAPGAQIVAGVNHYHTASVDEDSYFHSDNKSMLVVNNSSNPYGVMQGTSMSTPVTAGIVALWLQAAKSVNKSLTVSDVKSIMAQTAITDSYTSGIYASHFGKGKIDALAGIKYILQTTPEPSTGVTIGDNATNSTNKVPYNNYWTYSTTQMLYSPAEIGKSGTINSIAFKVASTSSFTTTDLKVYLGHKSSIFSSSSDYMTSSNLTLVYSGSPTLGQSTGWETLTFNQGSFNYNGTDNLVVVVTTKSSKYNTSLKYYCYAGSGYVLSRGNDDTTGYGDITNTSYAYSTSTERPSIKIGIEESQSSDIVDIDNNATNQGHTVPYGNYYRYSTAQMLYTPTEIGKYGKISSIAFKVANATSFTTSEVKVYLGHKSGTFSSASDYVNSNNLTLVYSGSPTLGQAAGWETLTFNQGTFTYNGVDNLVVVVSRKSSSYTDNLKYNYYVTDNGGSYTLYRRNDSDSNYGDVTNTSSTYNISTNRPAVQIGFVDATPIPTPTGLVINSTNFPDANFLNWLRSQSYGADGVLTDAEIASITEIDVNGNNIQDMKGIEFFTSLKTLYCYDNQITSLNTANNTLLEVLGCSSNQLTTLDVSKNTRLFWLNCMSNQLTNLDLSNNTVLEQLRCQSNQLNSLNVTKNTILELLICSENRLSALDVSKNTGLKELQCHDNNLSVLDVSNNVVLETLQCYSNNLTTIDLSKNVVLTFLGCNDNRLTSLDVSKNTALIRLYCYNNNLDVLDVSNNTALTLLSCHINQLSALDVSKNTALTLLSCRSNQITALDVSNNTALRYLYCSQNRISGNNMDDLIRSLPYYETTNYASLYVYDDTEGNEGNVCTRFNVNDAKAKGWIPKFYDGDADEWKEYLGSLPAELTLVDGEDYSGSSDEEIRTLHYSRTFKNTYWQAWYVPFDVTLTSEIMEHFAFAKFAGTYTEEDGSFYITVVRLNEGDVVKANTPYCVQAKVADSTNPQVITQTNAILKAAAENSFYMLSAEKKITFWGNYTRRAVTAEDHDVYAMSGGKYSRQLPGNILAPFRCFFTIENREDNPYASTPNPTEVKLMVLEDDNETGIVKKHINGENDSDIEVYDLSGRKLSQQNMHNGIYIINGKKILVK